MKEDDYLISAGLGTSDLEYRPNKEICAVQNEQEGFNYMNRSKTNNVFFNGLLDSSSSWFFMCTWALAPEAEVCDAAIVITD